MADRRRTFLVAFVVAIVGGVAMYLTRFIGVGGTPESVRVMQLTWELVSTAIFGLAALAGYGLYVGGGDLQGEYPDAILLFFVAGLLGHAAGFAALALAPPEGFSIGPYPITFSMMTLQEVVPFTMAAFSGAAIGTFRAG